MKLDITKDHLQGLLEYLNTAKIFGLTVEVETIQDVQELLDNFQPTVLIPRGVPDNG